MPEEIGKEAGLRKLAQVVQSGTVPPSEPRPDIRTLPAEVFEIMQRRVGKDESAGGEDEVRCSVSDEGSPFMTIAYATTDEHCQPMDENVVTAISCREDLIQEPDTVIEIMERVKRLRAEMEALGYSFLLLEDNPDYLVLYTKDGVPVEQLEAELDQLFALRKEE